MAVQENALPLMSEPAAADLSAAQYKIVRMTSTGINVVSAANQKPLGILDNDPVAGEAAAVQTHGRAKVIAGAAIAKGAKVMADSSARAITATVGSFYVLGTAMTAVAAAGELVEVWLSEGEITAAS